MQFLRNLWNEIRLDRSNWLGFVFLLMGVIPWNPGRFIHAGYVGFIGGVFLISWMLRKYFDWSVCLAFFYLMFNGITYGTYPRYFFGVLAPTGESLLPGILYQALVWLSVCAILSIFAIIKRDGLTYYEKALHWVFWGQFSFLLVSKFIFTDFTGLGYKETHGRFLGMVDNEAQDACLLLILYPLILLKNEQPLWKHILVTAVIFASGSSTAYFGYALMWIIYFGLKYFMKPQMWIGLLLAAVAITVGYFTVGWNELISTSGRYNTWCLAMKYWWASGNKVWGVGIGSVFLYLPGLQLQGTLPGQVNMVWVWMHNTWLQTLFELGFVGLGLVTVMYFRMLISAIKRNNSWLFISVILYGVTNAVQMHERHEMLTVVGLFLLVKTLGKRSYVWLK